MAARLAAVRAVQRVLREYDEVAGVCLGWITRDVAGVDAEVADLRVFVTGPERLVQVGVRGPVGARDEPETAGVPSELVEVEAYLGSARGVLFGDRAMPRGVSDAGPSFGLDQDEIGPEQI